MQLTLSFNTMAPIDVATLAQAISCLTSLESLCIEHNVLPPGGEAHSCTGRRV